MTCSHTPSGTDPVQTCPRCAADAVIERDLAVLARLGDLGMALAEALVKREAASTKPVTAEERREIVLSFERIARAVRWTLALRAKLATERAERQDRVAREEAAAVARRSNERRHRQRAKLKRIATEAIRLDERIDDVEAILDELEDRFDEYEELLDLPLGEALVLICRDLGLEPDWTQWPDEEWVRVASELSCPPAPS